MSLTLNDDNAPGAPTELEQAMQRAETEAEAEGLRYEPRFEPLAAMTCRSISDMTDGQLEDYISKYQDLVHQAEQNLESRKARLSAGRVEKAERAAAGRARSATRRKKLVPLIEQSKPSSIGDWLKQHTDGDEQKQK